jgi:hypothetical protein
VSYDLTTPTLKELCSTNWATKSFCAPGRIRTYGGYFYRRIKSPDRSTSYGYERILFFKRRRGESNSHAGFSPTSLFSGQLTAPMGASIFLRKIQVTILSRFHPNLSLANWYLTSRSIFHFLAEDRVLETHPSYPEPLAFQAVPIPWSDYLPLSITAFTFPKICIPFSIFTYIRVPVILAETEGVEPSHRFLDFTAFEAANYTNRCLQWISLVSLQTLKFFRLTLSLD